MISIELRLTIMIELLAFCTSEKLDIDDKRSNGSGEGPSYAILFSYHAYTRLKTSAWCSFTALVTA